MRSLLPASLIILFLVCDGWLALHSNTPVRNKSALFTEEYHESPADGIREWSEYEFNLLKNPRTGTIPEGTFAEEWAQALATEKLHDNVNGGMRSKATSFGTWNFKGPSNLGGRTRAIGIDINNNNIIIAGNVSGGVCRSTDGGASWTNVTPTGNIKNITSIAQDTRSGQTSTWYLCTGEGFGNSVSATAGTNSAFYLGNGVYKSTDNGITWARLTGSNGGSDETFDDIRDLCWKVAVNPANGDVYLAAVNTIYRSTNGGTNWSAVLSAAAGSSSQATDIVITTTGTMYAAISGNAGDATKDGVWTSTNGTTWTRLSGLISSVQTPSTWNALGSYGRIVLALAPSSQTTLYALYDNKVTSNCTTPALEAELFKYDATGGTWTDLSANLPNETGCSPGNDPFAVQGGYDLCIAVKPDNANTVFVGGTNVYRSTNGFTSTAATTRIGGYANTSGYSLYTNHHSDIHELKFASGSNDVLYTGDDGGIQKADITASTPAWTSLNNGYPSYQYFKVALDPTTGSSITIGGAQDNGTTYMAHGSTSATSYFSGDGGSVGTTAGGSIFYFSTQNGSAYRSNGGTTSIEPATSKSLFVTNFHLDPDNTSYLYYANGNDLYRTGSASTTTTSTGWTLLSGLATSVGVAQKIYGIATSRGTYSANTGAPATLSRLYVGTDNGQLFRLNDPQNVTASTSPADITPTGMTGLGTIVDIAVDPTDSRKIMAVYSNYGVSSVWYTADASVASPAWSNVEGNISTFSFRSVAILSNGTLTNYVVGTSKGIYSTATLNAASTVWLHEAPSIIGYVPVLDLAYRTADQSLLAGTHGNGMFLTTNFPLPLRFISFDARPVSSENVALAWTVNGAEDISNFVVQRSTDGKHWVSAVTVGGDGNGSVTNYSATDYLHSQKGTIYYRIRATEQSGDSYYSMVVSVNLPDGSATTGIYPTMVSQYLNIDAEGAGLTAVLTDMQGRRLAAVQLKSGRNTENLSMLAAGHYTVSIYKGSRLVRTSRIIKQ